MDKLDGGQNFYWTGLAVDKNDVEKPAALQCIFSDKKIMGWKFLGRNKMTTSIKIEFVVNNSFEEKDISKLFAKGFKTLDDEFIEKIR